MKQWIVTQEIKYEATDIEEAREFARAMADHTLNLGAYSVSSTGVAELTKTDSHTSGKGVK